MDQATGRSSLILHDWPVVDRRGFLARGFWGLDNEKRRELAIMTLLIY